MSTEVTGTQGGGVLTPLPLGGNQEGGKAMTVKQIKRALKKQHKKTTGKRATLMKRLRSKVGGQGKTEDNSETEEDKNKVDEVPLGQGETEADKALAQEAGRRHTAKHLKQLLKKHGMKTTGTKRALTRRAKKARLL